MKIVTLKEHIEFFKSLFGIDETTLLEVVEEEDFIYKVKTPTGKVFRVTKSYF
jgi:hypothetical protein